MYMFSYPSVLTYVLGAPKNHLIEMFLLITHNICFGLEIRKLNFCYTLLTKVLVLVHKPGSESCMPFYNLLAKIMILANKLTFC